MVESKRANKIAEFGLKFTAYKRNLFQVSIDEKHFECRAESDFNTFGTIVTISQSEQDVVFTLGLMAQGSVTFSTDREKYYISFNSSRTAVNDLSASTHKQE